MDGIIVYQPGRVGSTNVVVTLRHNGFDKTMHVHHYDEYGNPLSTDTGWKGKLKNPKYITIVRDPIARNLSSFCFGIKKFVAPYVLRSNPSDKFKADYFLKLFRHDYILEFFYYFNENVKTNVWGVPFDRNKKYTIWDNKLILRTENLDETFPQATKEFLNKELKLERGHRKKPPYLGMVKYLPNSYYDTMYKSRYMWQFYSKDEIEKFRTKWKEL